MTATTSIVPISLDRHGRKAFRRFTSYSFAGAETVVPIVAAEVPKAAMNFPLAFIKQGEELVLVGVMGLEPGSNLFVAPDGKWIGAYVPAAFRAYPYLLAKTEDGRHVLCVNEASGLVVEGGQGERFFDDAGNINSDVRAILDFLTKVQADRAVTERACKSIGALDILEPWPIVITKDNAPVNVAGLWRIDEKKLNALPDDAFLELRKTAALVLIYSHLLSMGQLAVLERLLGLKAQITKQAKAPVPDSLDGLFGMAGASQEIDIDWSKFRT